jgi:hypothetical protein
MAVPIMCRVSYSSTCNLCMYMYGLVFSHTGILFISSLLIKRWTLCRTLCCLRVPRCGLCQPWTSSGSNPQLFIECRIHSLHCFPVHLQFCNMSFLAIYTLPFTLNTQTVPVLFVILFLVFCIILLSLSFYILSFLDSLQF